MTPRILRSVDAGRNPMAGREVTPTDLIAHLERQPATWLQLVEEGAARLAREWIESPAPDGTEPHWYRWPAAVRVTAAGTPGTFEDLVPPVCHAYFADGLWRAYVLGAATPGGHSTPESARTAADMHARRLGCVLL